MAEDQSGVEVDSTTDGTAEVWDPDRDGKPGISWPAASILIAAIVGVVVLAAMGRLDLGDLLTGVLGAGGGFALRDVGRKP